jgi:hypothetical protein
MKRIAIAAALAIVAGCSSNSNATLPAAALPPGAPAAGIVREDNTSLLKLLKKQVVIGSTIDPKHGQLNPYGLTVAPSTNGDFTAGDLIVCNFNAKSNVQGTGYTVVALHPTPGSKPLLVSDSKTLTGCSALALDPGDNIWAAAFSSNDNPVFSDTGQLEVNIKGKPFDRPWGQVYGALTASSPYFFETNAADGTIVRIGLGTKFTYDVIAKGFAVNHGKPGSIFAPSGLTYDPNGDTLYIVDGTNNTIVALSNATVIPPGGIVVEKDGKTFKGPDAKDARLVFAGTPLSGPISATLLPNENLVIGNTGNPSGQNLMVELTPSGKVLDVRNVDKGASGSLFGIVATGSSDADTKIYFNDDNDNNLQVLEK